MEDVDPVIKPLKENYYPYSNRFEGRNYSLFDQPPDYGDDIDFKVEESINLDGNLKDVFPEAEEAFKQEEVTEMKLSENLATNLTGEKYLKSLNSFLAENKT